MNESEPISDSELIKVYPKDETWHIAHGLPGYIPRICAFIYRIEFASEEGVYHSPYPESQDSICAVTYPLVYEDGLQKAMIAIVKEIQRGNIEAEEIKLLHWANIFGRTAHFEMIVSMEFLRGDPIIVAKSILSMIATEGADILNENGLWQKPEDE